MVNFGVKRTNQQNGPQHRQASSGPSGFRAVRPQSGTRNAWTKKDATKSSAHRLPRIPGAHADVTGGFDAIAPAVGTGEPRADPALERRLRQEVDNLTMLCGSMQLLQAPQARRASQGTGVQAASVNRRAWIEMMMVQTPKLMRTLGDLLEQEERSRLRLAPVEAAAHAPRRQGTPSQRMKLGTPRTVPPLPLSDDQRSKGASSREGSAALAEGLAELERMITTASESDSGTVEDTSARSRPPSTPSKDQLPQRRRSLRANTHHWGFDHRAGNLRNSRRQSKRINAEPSQTVVSKPATPPKPIEKVVENPEKRGISAEQFRMFFAQNCGDIIGADVVGADSSEGKPICMPLKLAERCVQKNLENPNAKHPYDTNLYAVNEFFIKPLTSAGDVCISYAELVNPEGLLVEFFMSHHWGEDFGELVQGILRHAMVSAALLGKRWQELAYWCCAFANNQHQVDLGTTLETSPFYLALSSTNCRGTIMNLNQVASALQRTWCIYETHLTHIQGKTFTINTPQGPLVDVCDSSPEKDMWVKHIFRLLQHINVANASATNQEDHRKIMEEVAKFRKDGIEGAQALDTQVRAILANEALSTLARSGDKGLVEEAIRLKADIHRRDRHGVLPLTYAAGSAHSTVASLLLDMRADPRAEEGAAEVLDMWASRPDERRKAIDAVTELCRKASLREVHGAALENARLNNAAINVAELSGALTASEARLRLEALLQLGKNLIVLSEKGASGPATAYMRREARKLAGCLGDIDAAVQRAAVEALGSLGQLPLGDMLVDQGEVPSDYLEIELNGETSENVVLLAARSISGHALYALIKGVQSPFPREAIAKRDRGGRNVVHLAALSGHAECIRALVSECCLAPEILRQSDADHRTALHHAAASGNLECLKTVWDLGGFSKAYLGDDDAMGKTAVHLAAEGFHWDVVRALALNYGVDKKLFGRKDKTGGWNVVHYLASDIDNGAECLRELAENNLFFEESFQAKDKWSRTPAHIAAMHDNYTVLQVLQDLHAGVHLPAHDPSHRTIGQIALVRHEKELTRKGLHVEQAKVIEYWRLGRVVHIDRHGRTKFVYEDNQEGPKDQEHVDPERSVFRPTPMVFAELFGCERALKVLESYWDIVLTYTDISAQELRREAALGSLPVGLIAASDNVKALSRLISQGIVWCGDLAKQDGVGRNAIHRAASTGQCYNVEVVLGVGAFGTEDFVIADHQGWTALHHAAKAGDADCMQLLLDKCHFGPEHLRATDEWYRTPVHIAALYNSEKVLRLPAMHAALHLPMGSALPETGNVAYVRTAFRSPTSHAESDNKMTTSVSIGAWGTKRRLAQDLSEGEFVWQLGMVDRAAEDGSFAFRYECGGREAIVQPEQCLFAPTPLLVAEAMKCEAAAEVLRQHWVPLAEQLHISLDDLLVEVRQGMLPSGIAAARGKASLIREIMDSQSLVAADFVARDGKYRNALHWAARSGSADAVKVVADFGHFEAAELEAYDMHGRTVVHLAAEFGDELCMKEICVLIGTRDCAVSDMLNRSDRLGYAPVHVATVADKGRNLNVLLEHGAHHGAEMCTSKADNPHKAAEGSIALAPFGKEWRIAYCSLDRRHELPMLVCENGDKLMVKDDVQSQCIFGPTPLELAMKMDRREAAEVLRRHGAGVTERRESKKKSKLQTVTAKMVMIQRLTPDVKRNPSNSHG